MEHFLHFIINKQSRKSKEVFRSLLVELPKYTQKYKLYPTKDIDEVNKLLSILKNKMDENDIFVVVGGDGSLNQFITLYKKYRFNHLISYIPSGSGNDFARTHNIPLDTKKAIKDLFQNSTEKSLAIIEAKENSDLLYAVNSIGFGIDGLINQIVDSKGNKKDLGALAYISALTSAFIKQRKFPVSLITEDSEYHFKKAQLVLVANNPFFGGGINILPEANGQDDVLDVLIAEDVSLKDLFFIVSKLLTNRKHLSHRKLHPFKSKKLNIRVNSDQYGQKDGEVFKQKNYNYTFQASKINFWI